MRAIILWNILCRLRLARCNMRFHVDPFKKNRREHRDRREHPRESDARRGRDGQNWHRSPADRSGPPSGSLRRNSAEQPAGSHTANRAVAETVPAQKISRATAVWRASWSPSRTGAIRLFDFVQNTGAQIQKIL